MTGPPPKPYIARAGVALCICAFLLGILIGALHLLAWLKNGVSEDYSFGAFLDDIRLGRPHITWVGIQHILDWVMAQSAAFVLIVGGTLLGWLFGLYTEDYGKQLAKYESDQRTAKIDADRQVREAEREAARLRQEERRAQRPPPFS